MGVAVRSTSRSTVDEIAAAVEAGARIVFIAGAPGVGKTSALAAAARRLEAEGESVSLWVSGGVVASEGHLTQLLLNGLEDGLERGSRSPRPSLEAVCKRIAGDGKHPRTLAIDDFDTLIFKRESVAAAVRRTVLGRTPVRLLATCRPSALDRLIATPVLAHREGEVTSVTIGGFDTVAARDLIRRRAPLLSAEATTAVIADAGGHPAALVYLARIAELRVDGDNRSEGSLGDLFERAAEFAGAVYAESWALLGPQQRAILWQLGSLSCPATAAEVAGRIALSASHVSAQITRLIAEGLVHRTDVRAHFGVAPLLARWIAKRSTGERRRSGGSDGQVSDLRLEPEARAHQSGAR